MNQHLISWLIADTYHCSTCDALMTLKGALWHAVRNQPDMRRPQ